jgi:putative transposase
VCHSDAGSHFTSLRYSERIAEIGAVPSIGSIGHPYDNALAETVNSLSKTELIRQQGPWRSIDDVTPTEYEAAYTLHRAEADQPVGIQ